MKRVRLSAGTAVLTAGSFTAVQVRRDLLADTNAEDVPHAGFWDRIELELTGLVASNMNATMKLTYDVGGDVLASNTQSVGIERGETTATSGGAVFSLAGDFPPNDDTVPGEITAWVEIDGTGNPTGVARLIWRDEVV